CRAGKDGDAAPGALKYRLRERVAGASAAVVAVERPGRAIINEAPHHDGKVPRIGRRERLVRYHRHRATLLAQPEHGLDEVSAFSRCALDTEQARRSDEEMLRAGSSQEILTRCLGPAIGVDGTGRGAFRVWSCRVPAEPVAGAESHQATTQSKTRPRPQGP